MKDDVTRILRSSVAGARPLGRLPGEMYWNDADKRLGIIDLSGDPYDLYDTAVVSPEQYGAAADPLVDDTQAFLDALATKQTVVCNGAKTYYVNDLVIGSNEWLYLNGATLSPFSADARWVARLEGFNQPKLTNGLVRDLEFYTLKTAILSADVSAGTSVLPVEDSSQYEFGMVIAGHSTDSWDIMSRRVLSVADGEITLEEGTQCDMSEGTILYGGFGVVTVRHNGTMRFTTLSDLEIAGGAIGTYYSMDLGGDGGRVIFERLYRRAQVVAAEYVGTGSSDCSRAMIEDWGGYTRGSTLTAFAGQQVISVLEHSGPIPINRVFDPGQFSIRIDGVQQDLVAYDVTPGAGQVSVSETGLILTLPEPLAGGEEILVNVFDKSFFNILQDAHGENTVSGAHKWMRYLGIQAHLNARFDSTSDDAGLMHLCMCHFDGANIHSLELTRTNKFYGTHVFLGHCPNPLALIDFGGVDRRIVFNGVHTKINTSNYFDPAIENDSFAVRLEGTHSLNTEDGKPNIVMQSWWGPDFSIKGNSDYVHVEGNLAERPEDSYGKLRVFRPQGDTGINQFAFGGSLASPQAVGNDRTISQLGSYAYDGSSYEAVAYRRVISDQTISATGRGALEQLLLAKNNETAVSLHTVSRWDFNGFWRMGRGENETEFILGSGHPEGSVTAGLSSLYIDEDGEVGDMLFLKATGDATNTGWVNVVTADSGQAHFLPITGGTMTGPIDMNGRAITQLLNLNFSQRGSVGPAAVYPNTSDQISVNVAGAWAARFDEPGETAAAPQTVITREKGDSRYVRTTGGAGATVNGPIYLYGTTRAKLYFLDEDNTSQTAHHELRVNNEGYLAFHHAGELNASAVFGGNTTEFETGAYHQIVTLGRADVRYPQLAANNLLTGVQTIHNGLNQKINIPVNDAATIPGMLWYHGGDPAYAGFVPVGLDGSSVWLNRLVWSESGDVHGWTIGDPTNYNNMIMTRGYVENNYIEETGGDATNGYYIKYTSGILICWRKLEYGDTTPTGGTGVWGDPYVFQSADMDWTYPHTFLTPPIVNTTVQVDNNGSGMRTQLFTYRYCTVGLASGGVLCRVATNSNAAAPVKLNQTAIGISS